MKRYLLLFALAISVVLFAQDAPKMQTAPPATPPAHAHGGTMGMHHMTNMEDQAAKMRATLEKMKANLSKINDPALKQQAQYDVDLWEDMVQHMESMARMMKAHEGMGMGGTGMGHPMPPSDNKTPAPEKK
jgi:hypothetical protein